MRLPVSVRQSMSLCTLTSLPRTALIVFRLWRTSAGVSALSTNPDRSSRTIRIIVESGALYTLSILLIVCTLPNRAATECIGVVVKQVVVSVVTDHRSNCVILTQRRQGIAFNLIIIRVHVAHDAPLHGNVTYPALPTTNSVVDSDRSGDSTIALSLRQLAGQQDAVDHGKPHADSVEELEGHTIAKVSSFTGSQAV